MALLKHVKVPRWVLVHLGAVTACSACLWRIWHRKPLPRNTITNKFLFMLSLIFCDVCFNWLIHILEEPFFLLRSLLYFLLFLLILFILRQDFSMHYWFIILVPKFNPSINIFVWPMLLAQVWTGYSTNFSSKNQIWSFDWICNISISVAS